MQKRLRELNLPEQKSREEMLSAMQENVYGTLPPKPDRVRFEVKEYNPDFCAGKASHSRVEAHCTLGTREFSFPFQAVLPTDGEKHPFFIHINFRPDNPDRYQPTEELVDNGFAVLSFDYNDVTKDDGDFTHGLAGVLYPDGKRKPADPGKIAMWAWAAMRVMDYAESLSDVLDLKRATVCGHSRLGKTALLAAALDTRFAFAYSNESGCSGAAVTRGKQGERVRNICTMFPYWFCENYRQYMDREAEMPFDQHYLVASIAPRKVLVGSAKEDLWADPEAEQLCCMAASSAFPKGFVGPDRAAQPGEMFFDGDIGYHLRSGTHFYSREDWNRLIRFVNIQCAK